MSELRDRIKRLDTIKVANIVGFAGGNPKRRTDRDRSILSSSLDTHGYVLPVAVREIDGGKFELIDGHGRVDDIRARDVAEIKALVLDVESVAEGRRILLALKHTAEWDFGELEGFVRDTIGDGTAIDEIMSTSGLTAADLDVLGNAGAAFLDQVQLEADKQAAEAESTVQIAPKEIDEEKGAARALRVKIYDDDAVAEATFEHYRAAGFPYPNPSRFECMLAINRLASMSLDQLVKSTVGYDVADKFQRHRFASSAENKRSPLDSFNDDKQLARAIELSLGFEASLSEGAIRGLIGLVKNTQACSNFRPGFAAHLYRRFCPSGGTVLDTSTGYGGRLVGAIASTVVGHYVGIDPNTPTVAGNRELLKYLGREDFATLIELPAEDVKTWSGSKKKRMGDSQPVDTVLEESCDFAFTSPPYFRKEHYSDDDTQSWKRYEKADQWREGFLLPMMALYFKALKAGARCAINIGDVLIGSTRHPLGEWTVDCAKRVGFTHEDTLEFPMSRRFGSNQKDEIAVEPVFIFRKPS